MSIPGLGNFTSLQGMSAMGPATMLLQGFYIETHVHAVEIKQIILNRSLNCSEG